MSEEVEQPIASSDTECGSRDKARGLLTIAGERLYEALVEVNKLHEKNKKRVEYRYADAYLGIALNNVELAKIAMRKRKRKEQAPKEEVPSRVEKPEPII